MRHGMALLLARSLCNVVFLTLISVTLIHCTDKVLFECDFDGDDCQWSQPYHFKWTPLNHSTPSDNTGPRYDHTTQQGGKGYFYYLETSAHQSSNGNGTSVDWIDGQQAMLTSPSIPVSTGCPVNISFYYNMYGRDVGSLILQIKESQTVLWKRSGQQQINGVTWKEARVIVPPELVYPHFQLNIIGERGSSAFGDIGIDDVTITQDTGCHDYILMDCNFDNNKSCPMTQSTSDDFDWRLHAGQTNTMGTGPNGDHTRLNGTQGQYIFVEASTAAWGRRHQGDTAILVSPLFHTSASCQVTLTFFYSMYGAEIGNLSVKIHGSEGPVVWEVFGQQHRDGDTWSRASIDFPRSSNSNSTEFQFEIIGTRGQDYHGDIAVDDILVQPNCSQQVTNSTQSSSTANTHAQHVTTKPLSPHTDTTLFTTKPPAPHTNTTPSTTKPQAHHADTTTTTTSLTKTTIDNTKTTKQIDTTSSNIQTIVTKPRNGGGRTTLSLKTTRKSTRKTAPIITQSPMITSNISYMTSLMKTTPALTNELSTQNHTGGNNHTLETSTLITSKSGDKDTSHTNIGLIVGAAIGGFLAFAILLVMALLLFKAVRKRKVAVAPSHSLPCTEAASQEPGPSQQPQQIQMMSVTIGSNVNTTTTDAAKSERQTDDTQEE